MIADPFSIESSDKTIDPLCNWALAAKYFLSFHANSWGLWMTPASISAPQYGHFMPDTPFVFEYYFTAKSLMGQVYFLYDAIVKVLRR